MKKLSIIIITVLLGVISNNINAQTNLNDNAHRWVPNFEDYSNSPFAIKVHASPLLPFMITDLRSDTYSSEIKNGLGVNFGADFVYYFYSKERFRIGINTGLAFSNYRSTHTTSYESNIWTTDIDNDEVLITETVTNMYEKQRINFLDIPVKFTFEYLLSNETYIYVSVGATYGLSIRSTYTNQATINRTGYYPIFDLLIYDVDVDGSPYFYPSNKQMMTTDELNTKSNISFETSFGIVEKINDKFSLMFGFKYMHGFSDIIEGNNTFIVKHDASYHYSLNSLLERGDQIKTRGFGFEVGIQMNLWK